VKAINDMTMLKPTIGQLEREISNQIRSFYISQLGQNPGKIICHFFDTQLVISVASSVSRIEATLAENNHLCLAEVVRDCINAIIRPHLQNLIEESINCSVIDLVSHTSFITGTTGILVMMEVIPDVRNSEIIPKFKHKNVPNLESG
jgi:uncharacterized protein YbcI